MDLRTFAWSATGVVITTTAAVVIASPMASAHAPSHWSDTWQTAVQPPTPSTPAFGTNWSTQGFNDQTVRQVVRVSSGGQQVRITLSNQYGTAPLHVAGATIAASDNGAAVQQGTVRHLSFDGRSADIVPAGHAVTSDAVALPTTPLESLTVTLYLAGATGPSTFHEDGLTTTYSATGDHVSDTDATAFAGATSHSFYYLSEVDVTGGPADNTVVSFGDSITNGHNSTIGGNDRYSDALAERLVAAHRDLGVANVGITGNLLLSDSPCFGEEGLTRFQRDVLEQPGVRTVIMEEGTNDIWDSEDNFGCGITKPITADQIIAAYKMMIREAHAHGIRVVGATMLPFKMSFMPADQFARAEAIRTTVNHWILTSGAYDSVVDFAKAVADPADPQQLNPIYNSGDSLHPNDAGYRAMAAVVNLNDL